MNDYVLYPWGLLRTANSSLLYTKKTALLLADSLCRLFRQSLYDIMLRPMLDELLTPYLDDNQRHGQKYRKARPETSILWALHDFKFPVRFQAWIQSYLSGSTRAVCTNRRHMHLSDCRSIWGTTRVDIMSFSFRTSNSPATAPQTTYICSNVVMTHCSLLPNFR